MIVYPVDFKCLTKAGDGRTSWPSQSADHKTLCAVPVEFAGPGGALSPEDLYAQALTNCFVATFKVFAENSKLSFSELRVSSRLVVDLGPLKKPIMKEFYLDGVIVDPSHAERALVLAKKAQESGFILNSVKTDCYFTFKVESSAKHS
jgi:organic hydroperoxide reductase OsmC/OhrA